MKQSICFVLATDIRVLNQVISKIKTRNDLVHPTLLFHHESHPFLLQIHVPGVVPFLQSLLSLSANFLDVVEVDHPDAYYLDLATPVDVVPSLPRVDAFCSNHFRHRDNP